ncbi:MAG: protein-methionine-sulfoxide reductase catalytic subunit MsrP [Anaerolineaceae bacterium]|jgi:sulfoxide reductase catalytic subunit YedY|nr:protein-methionine-sulfoxide reductase catalytic subunit MsrP [Anaerolineaceae bacterium]
MKTIQPTPKDQVTPKELYLNRRDFLRAMGLSSAALLLAACEPSGSGSPAVRSGGRDVLTAKEDALNYVNFYEFSLSKNGVTKKTGDFKIDPWEIQIDGLVKNPQTVSFDELTKRYPIDEHIYRMRCVEGWSMVLPWQGFQLRKLLKDIKPLDEARYVQFQSVLRPDEMPGQVSLRRYPWPYSEGLRLDEAMHELTLMATGMYDEPLTKQNGAPIRLVVPWKYGFKGIKSIAHISLVKEEPATLWKTLANNEYGFYANVNPAVDHPRWSQATEIRIGENSRRPTLLFNGYDEVADLYDGMDLSVNF